MAASGRCSWTWDPLPANLDFLRQDDVLTITYTAQ